MVRGDPEGKEHDTGPRGSSVTPRRRVPSGVLVWTESVQRQEVTGFGL